MKSVQRLACGMTVAALFSLPLAVQAEEWIRSGTETRLISGGVFLPEINTKLRVNNTNIDGGLGVDLEEKLNLNNPPRRRLVPPWA